jgi:hypothetical protein
MDSKHTKLGEGGTRKGQRKNIGNTLNGDYTAVHTDLI